MRHRARIFLEPCFWKHFAFMLQRSGYSGRLNYATFQQAQCLHCYWGGICYRSGVSERLEDLGPFTWSRPGRVVLLKRHAEPLVSEVVFCSAVFTTASSIPLFSFPEMPVNWILALGGIILDSYFMYLLLFLKNSFWSIFWVISFTLIFLTGLLFTFKNIFLFPQDFFFFSKLHPADWAQGLLSRLCTQESLSWWC